MSDKAQLWIRLTTVNQIDMGAVDKVDLLHALIQKAEDYGVKCEGEIEENPFENIEKENAEFEAWYAEKRKDHKFVAELEEMNNRMMVKTMWQNVELEEKLSQYEAVVAAAKPFELAGRNGDIHLELLTDEEWSAFLEALEILEVNDEMGTRQEDN